MSDATTILDQLDFDEISLRLAAIERERDALQVLLQAARKRKGRRTTPITSKTPDRGQEVANG